MVKIISGQGNHVKGKINGDCSCNECKRLRIELKKRLQRMMDCEVNKVFGIHKIIPIFRFTVRIDIVIGDSKRKEKE